MMRRGLLLGIFVLALSPGLSQASCGFGCLHRQIEAIRRQALPVRVLHLEERLTSDEKRLEAQDAYIAWLEDRATKTEDKLAQFSAFQQCFGEVPLTRYGEELGPSGYLFRLQDEKESQMLATTALDVTYPEDPVGAWVFANACNKERLSGDTSGFVQPRNQEVIPVNRELLVQGFVREEDRHSRASLSNPALFAHKAR